MALDNFEGDMPEISEEFSLEAILAEYKGISYIDGDKKTPRDVLDEKARRIVQEETGKPASEPLNEDFDVSAFDFLSVPDALSGEQWIPVDNSPVEVQPEVAEAPISQPEAIEPAPEPLINEDGIFSGAQPVSDFDSSLPEIDSFGLEDSSLGAKDDYMYSSASLEEEIIRSVSEVMETEPYGEDFDDEPRRTSRFRDDKPFGKRSGVVIEEEEVPEPDYRERARAFAIRCNELSGRAVLSLVLSILLTVATILFESGRNLPFGIGQNAVIASGVLLIIQILVMMLGVGVLTRGVTDIFEGTASAETLVFVSCTVSLLAGIYGMRTGSGMLPYSAISSFSLTFALWGERMYTQALTDTLRSAATVSSPNSLVSEYRLDMDRTVIRRVMGRHKGFYGNLQQADVTELAYRYAAPLLLLFCILITAYSSISQKNFTRFPAMLAATCAAAATFTSTLVFASPFRTFARQERAVGSAVAGPGGIDDIFYMNGLCVSDEDLYPPDTLDVGSVRILDQVAPEKAIRYTASMIIASGSCLSRVFTSILINKGMSLITTQDFTAGEGGVSGVIRGEQVHTGNYAYMNLYGVRVPDELKMGSAIYTAVDGRMIAMFSVDYRPSNSIRNAIMSVLRNGVKLYLTVRDFNITPMTVEQKFKIPMEDFELLPINRAYTLSDEENSRAGRTVAVCPNGGLVEMSRIISSARRVKLITQIGTIISVASSILGVVLMAVLGWIGMTDSARPGNLLIFMAAPLIIMLLTSLISGLLSRKDA